LNTFVKWLNVAILIIEILVAIALVVLAAGALMSLAYELWYVGGNGPALTRAEFNLIIGTVLEVFILVELFRIAIAYMRHQNVIPTVLEAALVAVARKFVVFEGGTDYLLTSLGMSALLLAVASSWWLLNRTGACTLEDH